MTFPGAINVEAKPGLIVVDDFLSNPDQVRGFALSQQYEEGSDYYKGRRSFNRFISDELKHEFQDLLGRKITSWEDQGMNGRFQFCTPQDPLVYHQDLQEYAGLLFLTPDAPLNTGTSFYRSKLSGLRVPEEKGQMDRTFSGGFFDSTKFDLVDSIGNVYNRLVLFHSRQIHAASCYFGQSIKDSRLFQIFFFGT
jgi:hypothetical protein